VPNVEVYKKIERFAAQVDIRKSLDAWVLAQSMKAYNKNRIFICDAVFRIVKKSADVFEDAGCAHATTDAHRYQSIPAVAPLEFADDRSRQFGAGAA
jgi:hypothetical protein